MELEKATVFVLSAPSGSGKSTLARVLLNTFPQLAFSISATTRQARGYEEDGKHYHFMSHEEFQDILAQGGFLEWEENYEGRFYGTLYSEVDRILAAGKFPVFDVDVRGGVSIKEKFGDKALTIFIQAPNLSVLEKRLIARGSESQQEVQERVHKAQSELEYKDRFDYVIINDDLERAKEEIIQLVAQFLPALES